MGEQWRKDPIVLIEDDPNDVMFVQEALRHANIGNPLRVHASLGEAHRECAAVPTLNPALFILDLNFPGAATGFDFLRWVRGQPPPLGTTPAMVLTGSDRPADHDMSLELGALCFLRKPVLPTPFVDAVQALGFVLVISRASGETGFRIIQRP